MGAIYSVGRRARDFISRDIGLANQVREMRKGILSDALIGRVRLRGASVDA